MSLLAEYRACQDPFAQGVLDRLLSTLCRHTQANTFHVSEAAQAMATSLGKGDLRQYDWNTQVKKLGDVGRKIFAWDHFVTVFELRRALDELATPTEASVRAILSRSSVAWILKTEDKSLDALGYRSRRPDPHYAYTAAGIRLLKY